MFLKCGNNRPPVSEIYSRFAALIFFGRSAALRDGLRRKEEFLSALTARLKPCPDTCFAVDTESRVSLDAAALSEIYSRSAALRASLRRKEIILSLLSRHLPFSSQARLGTVPGYYQPSRCAGLDLDAADNLESHKSVKGGPPAHQ
jgi:hypothetical protein